jgi:ABC-type branched-subunit amino acid transport system ATPase component/ABC-type branched-subunit amino acid transport system permease subunit
VIATLRDRRWVASLTTVVGLLVVWVIAAALLPSGLPAGVVVLGLVLGSLTGLTAMGLVLVYRANRIINFAQAELGGLAAVIALISVIGLHLPYVLAVVLGLAAAIATGALIDTVVVRRFENAPRLILTVATIGILQILGAAQIGLPAVFSDLDPLETFRGPLKLDITIGPVIFHGDDVVALAVVPIVLAALGWFLYRSDVGIAIRASADSSERALLLGIPVRRLSTVTWMVAAGLSGLGLILAAPIKGPNLGVVGGPPALLAPIAAAVIARMDRLPVAIAASLGIGVFEQAVFWNYPRSALVDVALFAAILIALLAQRRGTSRGDEGDLGRFAAVHEVRPVPTAVAELREVRYARVLGPVVIAALLLAMPWIVPRSTTVLLTYMLLLGIVAVSLVVLAGWAGQISLGQFAFVGLGAAVTGSLLVHQDADLFVTLALSAMAGGAAALLVGVPALRIRGLFLAATTLAFAVPVSTFLLNSGYFPSLNPRRVPPPLLLERFSLDEPRTLYYFIFAALLLAIFLTVNLRRSRAGRAVLAVRDNESAAAAQSVDPTRTKLFAFAFSGAIAGFAGGLFVVANRGISFAGFNPILSVEAFTAAVVGGLGSVPGALLGAAYVHAVQDFLGSTGELLATGAGLLLLLMIVPGGLGEVMYAIRDRALGALARRRGVELPAPSALGSTNVTEGVPAAPSGGDGLLRCDGVGAGYGGLQVLFGIDMSLAESEPSTLLGTNGAGKSTLLRVVSGILPATTGTVVYDGEDITKWSPAKRLGAGIVTVPGGRGVFPSLTVTDNLRMAGWLRRKDKDAFRRGLDDVFALFPVLRDRAAQRAASLSGGEQQMLTLAQALLCRPRLLMIDELSIGLAPTVVSELVRVVRSLSEQGVTLLVVEQSLNVAARLADRAVFLEKGQVRFTGSIERLLARPDLARAVFLRRPESKRRRRAARSGDGVLFRASSVGKHFGGVVAVDDVDLEVRRGEIVGIIGPNGAGKTTFVSICSGFLPPDSGRLSFGSHETTGLRPAELAERGIGRTFQDARLWPSLTVRESLALAFDRHVDVRDPFACALRGWAVVASERDVARRVEELLGRTGLGNYADTFVSELSTGTRRILELSCALAHDPDLLFLDEPTAGVAQRESEVLGELLLDLRDEQGMTLVVVEHNIPVVSAITDRLVCLDLGTVLAEGTPKAVLSNESVLASYLGTEETPKHRRGVRGARGAERSRRAQRGSPPIKRKRAGARNV